MSDVNRFANVMFGGAVEGPELMGWLAERVKRWFLSAGRVEFAQEAAADQGPAESPAKSSRDGAVLRMRSVINKARHCLQGHRSPDMESRNLEQALSGLREEFTAGGGVQFRVFVAGHPKPLKLAIQEQVYLIGREALINALRHSEATKIEAEIEYLPRQLRVLVRDNGRGMDPHIVSCGRPAHWGLIGMRARAAGIGAQLRIWSRLGAGTEVEISLPGRTLAEAYA